MTLCEGLQFTDFTAMTTTTTSLRGRFDGWVYRVRTAWWRIMEAFRQAGGATAIVFGKFFDWYAPYFSAYSFALARANEYQADAVSARVTSHSIFASALVQTNLLSSLLQTEFWGKLDRQVALSPSVHESIYTEMKRFLERDPFSRQQRYDSLEKLIKEKTGHSDTHPALNDRIMVLTDRIPNRFASTEFWFGRVTNVRGGISNPAPLEFYLILPNNATVDIIFLFEIPVHFPRNLESPFLIKLKKYATMAMNYQSYIVRDSAICGGQAVVRGTRVTVRTILASLGEGMSIDEIMKDFPTLEEHDVRAVIAFAAISAEEDLPVPPAPTLV
ncbi:MAG: DUF433 domain-containing protein [Methylococcales bacterium]